ncbi:MAG: phospholipase [Bacteroidetes bacterium]|nr:phospholipase [Bacteroidota bacterium]
MELKYIVREPENINANTTILFMIHGYGSNEQDLFSFVPTLPKDWIIVSYRAPKDTQFGGYSWYDIDFNNPDKFVDVTQANESLNALLKSMLDISNHYGLVNNQTHICGFSQGGVLTYAMALSCPEMFDKIAILSAYPEEKLLKNIVKDKKKLERLRFFVSHGADDAIIPFDWGKKGADLLYDLSCFFTFREYDNGHGINQKNYMDLMHFLEK